MTSHPRLGPPLLTHNRIVFLDDLRITFGRYDAFDANNHEFTRTTAHPRLPPPILLTIGTVSFDVSRR